MMIWISYFFVSAWISLIASFFLIEVYNKRGLKKGRKFKRLGGVGIILTFLVGALINPELALTVRLKGILLGSMVILLFGLWDDFRNISWRKQLFFQFILVFILIFSGFSIDYITNPFGEMMRLDSWVISIGGAMNFSVLSFLFILLWVVGVINAINWVDGIDGLSGGIGLLGAMIFLWISLVAEVNQPAIAIVSLIFAGSLFGFWWFNLPIAKIEAGSSGSYFIGFFLASMAIIAGTKIATAMIVLTIPVIDAGWVIFERFREGKSIFKRDNYERHLHYKLRKIGWSDYRIIISYLFFISCVFCAYFFLDSRVQKIVLLMSEVLFVVYFLYYISKRSDKFSK